MISTLSSGFIAASVLLASSIVSADLATVTTGLLTPTTTAPVGQTSLAQPPNNLGQPTDLGCYEGFQGMSFGFSFNYMTTDQCKFECRNKMMNVLGVSAGFDCYCGQTTPPESAKVDDSKCNMGCAGYGKQSCGGPNSTDGTIYMRVMNDMLNGGASISALGASAAPSTKATTSSSSPTTPVAPSVVTESGRVVTEYATPTTSPIPDAPAAKPSVAGIAAGVVVGIVAIAAICGGLFLFIRQKKRREVEEEHKRQVAASAFLAGAKPGSSHGSTDTRLDPAILRDRRLSDGSIMDNQDYSRRILKVTNA